MERRKRKTRLLLLMLLMLMQSGCGQKETTGTFEIIQQEVDAVCQPVGIDNRTPAFSWKLVSEEQGFLQKAYEIQVYEQDKLTGEKELVWDSGRVKSKSTSAIPYEGDQLKEHSAYVWTVTVTDNQGKCICSKEASFTTAFWQENAFSQGKFITMNPEENIYEDGQAVFRKEFVLGNQEIKEAVLYSSALGIYDGYVNGERVGKRNPESGEMEYDELKPGWTDYEDRLLYNTYDITEYLRKNEKNAMAFMVGTGWWCGRVSQGTYGYHLPAFIGELHILYEDGSREIIATDESWEYCKDTAVVSADIYNGEVYDCQKRTTKQESMVELESGRHPVYMPTEEVLGFTGEFQSFYGYQVQEQEKYTRKPESIVIYDGSVSGNSTYGHINEIARIEAWREEGTELASGSLRIKKGQTVIFDFGQNMTGIPYLKYQAKKGTQITLQFGEMLNDSGEEEKGNDGPKGSLYRENYRTAISSVTLTAGGEETEEYRTTFSYFGFRYISLEASEDIELFGITAVFIGNCSPECGNIITDNEKINRLIENIQWSQRNNFLLTATDCPQRDERLGWTGDTQVFQKTSMFNQDLRNFYRKWLEDLRDGQKEDNSYPDTVPYSIVTGSGNAGWADAGISVPYELYQQYGDIAYIEEMYESMSRYMDYLESISSFEGEGARIGALTAFGDWLAFEETDKEMVSAAYYARDARMMMEMAEALGKKKDQKKYKSLLKKIKIYFNKTYVIDSYLKQRTQTACLLALSNDLLDGKAKENAVSDLASSIEANGNKLKTGFLGTPELLPVLVKEGQARLAYELLLQEENPSWLYSINQGATTIWERWDSYTKEGGFHKDGMNSFNHFNNGSVGAFLYESLLGISIDAPEGKILLNPVILTDGTMGIQSCEGYYDSIFGKIQVKWSVSENMLSYEVTIPANGEAVLILPEEEKRKELQAGSYKFTQKFK
ncbi:MAG: glycoside hydrolase family 78 protein [Roseburia sp.]|nr:glycoside hydrolase family 78 protein [Roseburia sp.]MCM1277655.1 glycoside hydrolase family 78 protein [Robinsoniella sp.]